MKVMIVDTHTDFGDPAQPNAFLHHIVLPDAHEGLASQVGVTGTVVSRQGGQVGYCTCLVSPRHRWHSR